MGSLRTRIVKFVSEVDSLPKIPDCALLLSERQKLISGAAKIYEQTALLIQHLFLKQKEGIHLPQFRRLFSRYIVS